MFNDNRAITFVKSHLNEHLIPPTVAMSLNDEGLLPVDALTSPVTVTFPVWDAVRLNTSYQLLWDEDPMGAVKLVQEGDMPGDILTLDIPVDALTSGDHRLAYRLVNLINGVYGDSQSTPI